MKIWVYENSEGFTSYSAPLCEALTQHTDIDVSLMTVRNNPMPLSGIQTLQVLYSFDSKIEKRNTLKWVFNRVWISLINILKRNHLVRKHKPDILSIQETIPIIDQYFLSRLKRHCRLVYTAHDVIPPNKSRFWTMKSLNRLYQAVDRIIVHSETNKEQLIDKFGVASEKIDVIHHGLKTGYEQLDRSLCRQAVGVDDDTPIILFYGSIREQKGLDDLIRALSGLHCRLVIAGAMPHGESFDQYDALIQQTDISVYKIIDYVSDEQSNSLFQAADIVALPYKYFYSQSGVFMQAIQYGKYILATDVSSFGEYVRKWRLGCLCEPENIESIRSAVVKLCQWIRTGVVNEFADEAREENSWERSAELHIKVFERELNRSNDGKR
jgi:glycosyltransferase involved in cell wall biosynthesis